MADTVKVEPPVRDAGTLQAANDVLSGQSKKGKLAKLLPFLGPAFIASVAYMDPGNFATNIAAGAQFGYMLLWVIVAQQPHGHAAADAVGEARHCYRPESGRSIAAIVFRARWSCSCGS